MEKTVKLFSSNFSRRLVPLSHGNVFSEFSQMSAKHNAVNLGQGFPSFPPPSFLSTCLETAAKSTSNFQYTRPLGHPELCKAIASIHSPLLVRDIDPMTQVSVFNGAQEAIYCIFSALTNPGDEIVIVEPSFDCYGKSAEMLELKIKTVAMKEKRSNNKSETRSAKNWKIDMNDLENSLNNKTRILLINTPNSPIGKVLSKEELIEISNVVKKYPNLVVLSDEVYEFMTYDSEPHIRIATLDNMFERTITLSSAGKTFSATGWRVGYAIAPTNITDAIGKVMSAISFCAPTILQAAIALALKQAKEESYFEKHSAAMCARRDLLLKGLRDAGMSPVVPQGGYFVWCDFPNIKELNSMTSDAEKCRWLIREAGVCGIPGSAFYVNKNETMSIRFAFCKNESEIETARTKLFEMMKRQQSAL
eukprot:c19419_g1_i1.p1 GENE.c19419_g1_i1~~c19419_g1_i1.p1  ORF type:complete len:428 (+),score=162.33 c19419_g1_i1:25-1284(+)